MSSKTHWSRKPEQIRRDANFLRKAGVIFKEDSSGFYRPRNVELKNKVVDFLIETKFDGANTPAHQQAQKIWAENIEELKGV
jgi:hypothetical protein